ncbi:deoxyguanosinetriphosphate triphosphohydrolase [Desulfoscipio gibsoniae]|uniref:Deoxyguanosinetriphosphate triphosphohydrolase-like protein n=1 Tax=Desulfoscipio gibsoniae DSM 7213 TaxID=767817 RepID=R4KK08_9FIRM|nr:deoxyguanosinetriphosphate triphosphohydrolase [Desulfoscipio gibsoniae]AGL00880.1 deoxyguanosinetriphosphate triphosphohydrolase, putative [Desulfoscipio gibsoniae DSM 7213]
MEIRQHTEAMEDNYLSPFGARSHRSVGRRFSEEPCRIRTAFQRDRDRIIHSKAFRRLKHKTQVFIIPEGDHYRTRLTHTLEVAQIARTVARALRLNEDLTEAIALGHDLGHTPFGHAGENALNEIMPGGFKHNRQSLRVVEELEEGTGLNLTWEVCDGILHHTGPVRPSTLEGQVVKIADRVAYINHDIDDAIRGGILLVEDLPTFCLDILGREHRTRINTMVTDLIISSRDKPLISMSSTVHEATDKLRQFLFDHVYIDSEAKGEEGKARHVLQYLFTHWVKNPQCLPEEHRARSQVVGVERAVCDYIAGMTDRYAIAQFKQLFIPRSFAIPKITSLCTAYGKQKNVELGRIIYSDSE